MVAVVIMLWAALQLSWTIVLLIAQLLQVARQMTTLEMSNLGRYGFMGGRGTSMASQTNFLAQRQVSTSQPADGGEPASGHNHHHHRHGFKQTLAGMGGCLLRVVGLDLYTRGKAGEGIRRAGKGGNPFDLGFRANCRDFWSQGGELGVDYTSLFDVPPQGFAAVVKERKAMHGARTDPDHGRDLLPLTTQDVDRGDAKQSWSIHKPFGFGASGRGEYAQLSSDV